MRPSRALIALLLAAVACSPVVAPLGTPSPTVSPEVSPSPQPTRPPAEPEPVRFSAARALDWAGRIAALGPRETTSATYRRASRLVADRLRDLGYVVSFQAFEVPAGTVGRREMPAGPTRNVVAEPPGFDPAAPHLVVGGHLDTVPESPGANDNASGVAVVLELARLAAAEPPPMPVVFVAFAAEERRRQTPERSETFMGAQEYIDRMSPDAREGLRGMINLDMVGAGREVLVLGGTGTLTASALAAARRLEIPARTTTQFETFSDHQAFRDAGYPVAWLWAGDHPTLHTPQDTADVLQRAQLGRVGRVAWEMLRTLDLP